MGAFDKNDIRALFDLALPYKETHFLGRVPQSFNESCIIYHLDSATKKLHDLMRAQDTPIECASI